MSCTCIASIVVILSSILNFSPLIKDKTESELTVVKRYTLAQLSTLTVDKDNRSNLLFWKLTRTEVTRWSIPGFLVGSTIGSKIGEYLPASVMEKGLGGVLAAVGSLVLVLEFLSRR